VCYWRRINERKYWQYTMAHLSDNSVIMSSYVQWDNVLFCRINGKRTFYLANYIVIQLYSYYVKRSFYIRLSNIINPRYIGAVLRACYYSRRAFALAGSQKRYAKFTRICTTTLHPRATPSPDISNPYA